VVVDLRGVTTVLLPGTGSDHDYVRRAFSGPLREVGALLVTPQPRPGRLIDGYLSALDDAAHNGPIAVGGVSLGGTVGTAWALAHPDRAVAVLAALPAWVGAPDDARLLALVTLLTRFKEACDANKSQALVTVAPEDTVPHQRIIDVPAITLDISRLRSALPSWKPRTPLVKGIDLMWSAALKEAPVHG